MAGHSYIAGPGTLAPPVFPHATDDAAQRPARSAVRPFGLTRAVIAAPNPNHVGPVLTLCPERQISVTTDGTPFIHEPSMASEFQSDTQTKTDNQIWTDSQTDHD